jgi:hypothetical protein
MENNPAMFETTNQIISRLFGNWLMLVIVYSWLTNVNVMGCLKSLYVYVTDQQASYPLIYLLSRPGFIPKSDWNPTELKDSNGKNQWSHVLI